MRPDVAEVGAEAVRRTLGFDRLEGSLAQRANDFAVSGLRECLQGLRAHEAEAPELQNVASHHGVVRRLTDSDEVEVAHHHVELLHLAPHVCQKLLGGVEAARRILGGLDAGIGQAEERDVGGHCFPSSYGSCQRVAHCYYLRAPSSRLEQRNRAKRRDRLAASRGDPCRPPIRPIEPFAVVTRYVWFTSSIPAGR